MKGHGNFVAAAFALTALTYGLARFAFGLLLSDIRKDLALSATAAGWIGSAAFAAYCIGVVVATMSGVRLGERSIAVLAGLAATCGLALVAVAGSGRDLLAAIALAGLGTGLTSPPLAAAVTRCFEDTVQPKANGVINAGTAAGIVFSAVAVMAFAGSWRELYAVFAAIGAAVTVWLWIAMPAGTVRQAPDDLSFGHLSLPGVGGLCAGTILMGAGSTAIWTFGANVLRDDLGYSEGRVAVAWSILGTAGLAGAGTGILTDRLGIGTVHRCAVAVMAFALTGLAAASVAPVIIFVAMGLFGPAYIVSSGAFLLWGIALFPERPALGLGLPFLMLAIGQTVGALLFGSAWEGAGSTSAILSFAMIIGCAAFWIPKAASTDGRGIVPSSPATAPPAAPERRR